MGIDPVAIVGLGVRAPGAADADELWANLLAGRDCITQLTEEELLAAGEQPEVIADPNYVRARPLLDDVGGFDHRFFGMSAREAELRNPQHRLFLELCSTALQHAGYDPGRYGGEIGVYGSSAYDRFAEDHIRADPDLFGQVGEMVTNVSNNVDYLSTYVSYRMGLRGPSLSVRTACSSSLVAVHLASQALRQGDCDMALAGGVEIETPYGRGYVYVAGGIDSHDGRCRPLDAGATGTVFGSGGAVVLLKRLSDALDEGDNVIAVIRGSATNNDGAERPGFTAPSAEGQSRVISEALVVAGVDPASVSYVELHGTGTAIGDPIEVHGLHEAFRLAAEGQGQAEMAPGTCGIGSVKSNVGHLGPASGVVGLVKTALMLQHEQLVPTINVETPNPKLELDRGPFRIVDEVAPWPRRHGQPRLAGVSSFGFGGTNAHVVVEEAPATSPFLEGERPHRGPTSSRNDATAGEQPSAGRAELLVWSAMDDVAERELRNRLGTDLVGANGRAPEDVAFTAQVGRAALPLRSALRFHDLAEAARALSEDGAAVTARSDGVTRQPVFMFPGQGALWPGVATELARHLPTFSQRLREHLTHFGDLLAVDLLRLWEEETDLEVLGRTVHAQPLLFAVEQALAEELVELGITPVAVTGHSVGELVAATVAGVFDVDDAIRVVARRAELMDDLPAGTMLAVGASENEVRELLPPGVWVGAVNAARRVVVGGAVEDAAKAQELLRGQGIACRELPTSHAFHTPTMRPALDGLTEAVAACKLRPPRIAMVSAASGALLGPDEALSPQFWADQIVEPVQFLQAMDVVTAQDSRLLLEVGPGQALTSLARQHAAVRSAGHRVTSTLVQERGDEWASLLDAIGTAWVHGAEVRWDRLPRDRSPRRVPLPIYPYQRRHLWLPDARHATFFEGKRPHRGPGSSKKPVPSREDGSPRDTKPVIALPGWRPDRAVLPVAPAVPGTRGHAVVLLPPDPSAATSALAAVQLAGYRTTSVHVGDRLDVRSVHKVTVRPGEASDLARLFAVLGDRDATPSLVVHAQGLGDVADGLPADEPGLVEGGFWSTFGLLQAMTELRRQTGQPTPLTVLTQGAVGVTGSEQVHPARALATGLVRSAARELSAGQVRLVDVLDVDEAVLAAELAPPGDGTGDVVVALRGNRRWLPDLTPITPQGPSPSFLMRGGVYVVTGGLGGLGLATARGLAASGIRPHLVLLSRQASDDLIASQVRDDLRDLEAAGASVRLVAADVSDAARMRDVVTQLRDEYGRIDGIVHAAGLPGGGLIAGRSRQEAEAVLRPKVTGSVVLRDLAAEIPGLRFLVFFSSRAALNGLLGGAEYAAANGFQDALAASSTGMPATVLSINWPGWEATGMTATGTAAAEAEAAAGSPNGAPSTPQAAATTWRLTLDRDSWLVAEHWVSGRPTLPGTAYVDLLVRAVRDQPGVDELDAVVVEDLVLLAPLVVEGPVDVAVRLHRDGDGWSAEVGSEPEGGAAQRHATAKVSIRDDLERPSDITLPDRHWVEPDPSEASHGGPEFVMGPRFDCVTGVLGDGETPDTIVARLDLPPEFESDLDDLAVHPALLDRALALRLSYSGHVPFACRRVVVHTDLPAAVVARLHTRHRDAHRTVFDAELYDFLGRKLVEVEGFAKVERREQHRDEEGRDVALDVQQRAVGVTSSLTAEDGVATLMTLLTEQVPPTVAVVPADQWIDQTGTLGVAPAGPAAVPSPTAPATPASVGSSATPDGDGCGGAEVDQATLVRLWAETLGQPQVGPADHFFDLGGDSLTAVQLVARLQDQLGITLSVAELFDNPTPQQLAAALSAQLADQRGAPS